MIKDGISLTMPDIFMVMEIFFIIIEAISLSMEMFFMVMGAISFVIKIIFMGMEMISLTMEMIFMVMETISTVMEMTWFSRSAPRRETFFPLQNPIAPRKHRLRVNQH